jgi:hypothetical protein
MSRLLRVVVGLAHKSADVGRLMTQFSVLLSFPFSLFLSGLFPSLNHDFLNLTFLTSEVF